MKNLLFTGGGGVGNEAIFRFLYKKYNLFFADSLPDNINNIIPKKITRKIPYAHEENFC